MYLLPSCWWELEIVAYYCKTVCNGPWWKLRSPLFWEAFFPGYFYSPTDSLHHSACHTLVSSPFYSLVFPLDHELLEGRTI